MAVTWTSTKRLHVILAAGVSCMIAGGVAAHAQRPPAPVIVSEVLAQEVVDAITLVGTVQGRRNSTVASETDGKVVGVLKEAGQALRAGDPLIRLENDQLRAALIEALADVKLRRFNSQQSAALLREEAVSEQSQRDSDYEFDRAQAKLTDLRNQVEDLEIKAPFDGYVVQTTAELGEWIDRGEGVAQVISIDTVRIRVDVPEHYVDGLRLGASASLYIDALSSSQFEGRVVAILPQGLPDSRTFPVIVETLNPRHRMRGGMSSRVTLDIERPGTALLVHKDALVSGPMGHMVYLAQQEQAAARPVTAGMPHKGYVSVQGDLAAGDLVIVRGNERLQDGQTIRVIRRQE